MKKNMLILLMFLTAFFGCNSLHNNDNKIIGDWMVIGDDDRYTGVVEIDSSSFYYYYEGVGYIDRIDYFIKHDSVYFYNIIDNDTTIEYKYFIEHIDETNMKLVNEMGGDYYQRISKNKLQSFINQWEGIYNDSNEVEIIKIGGE